MTKKTKPKRLSLRQELRKVAETKLPAVKLQAAEAIDKIAREYGVDWKDLVKAISDGTSKTANHNLVTQLANKAEADLIEIWNDQQKLDLGEKDGDE
jgi:hypothetical protein